MFTPLSVCACVWKSHAMSSLKWVGQTAVLMRASQSIRYCSSLNSCLSTPLIKSWRRGEKIKAANGKWFQLICFGLEDRSRTAEQLHLSGRRGSCSTAHVSPGHGRRRCCLCKLDFGTRFVNQEQRSWIYGCCWLIPVIECTGVLTKLLQHLCGEKNKNK